MRYDLNNFLRTVWRISCVLLLSLALQGVTLGSVPLSESLKQPRVLAAPGYQPVALRGRADLRDCNLSRGLIVGNLARFSDPSWRSSFAGGCFVTEKRKMSLYSSKRNNSASHFTSKSFVQTLYQLIFF